MIHKINEAQRGALNVNRTVWRSLDSKQLLPVFTQEDFVHGSNPHSTCVRLWYLICLFRLERTPLCGHIAFHFCSTFRFCIATLGGGRDVGECVGAVVCSSPQSGSVLLSRVRRVTVLPGQEQEINMPVVISGALELPANFDCLWLCESLRPRCLTVHWGRY